MIFSKPWIRFVCREHGAAMVENAVVIGVVVFVLIAAVDAFRLAFVALSTQFVATRAIHEVNLGPNEDWNASATILTPADAFAEAQHMIETFASWLHVDLEANDIEICPRASFDGGVCNVRSIGGPGQMMVVQLTRDLDILLLGSYEVRGFALGRNEYYE